MRAGEFPDGAHVLRAKIDMASPNINMRDPVLYRIRHAHHHRTGDAWCIYPMYDFAHRRRTRIERITHSLCTLEFEDHRPLYDWLIDSLPVPAKPRQIEFARLNLTYTVMSKRKLLELVQEAARHRLGRSAHADASPACAAAATRRRRSATSASASASPSARTSIDVALLEHAVREDLNTRAPRVMGVLRPLKVVIENYPEGAGRGARRGQQPGGCRRPGTRKVPFSRVLYIERDDFREDPPKKFFRLAPGREVRLRCAYFITCTGVVKDPATGEVVELRCTYDPATRGGDAPDGRKVKATLHWVSAAHAVDAEVRLYDRLFTVEEPGKVERLSRPHLNPASLEVVTDAKVEPSRRRRGRRARASSSSGSATSASTPTRRPGAPVFNRTVTLKDTWARAEQKTSA